MPPDACSWQRRLARDYKLRALVFAERGQFTLAHKLYKNWLRLERGLTPTREELDD